VISQQHKLSVTTDILTQGIFLTETRRKKDTIFSDTTVAPTSAVRIAIIIIIIIVTIID
jgi:hypothetical protein